MEGAVEVQSPIVSASNHTQVDLCPGSYRHTEGSANFKRKCWTDEIQELEPASSASPAGSCHSWQPVSLPSLAVHGDDCSRSRQ